MVYAFLLIGAFMIGTILWTSKYISVRPTEVVYPSKIPGYPGGPPGPFLGFPGWPVGLFPPAWPPGLFPPAWPPGPLPPGLPPGELPPGWPPAELLPEWPTGWTPGQFPEQWPAGQLPPGWPPGVFVPEWPPEWPPAEFPPGWPIGQLPPGMPPFEFPEGLPGELPGELPGLPGGISGGLPGGVSGGDPEGVSGGVPGGLPGGVPGGLPGGVPGGLPGETQGELTTNLDGLTGTTKQTKKKKPIRNNLEGYIGNGWWSSDSFFGWPQDSVPYVPWGTGEKPPPGAPGSHRPIPPDMDKFGAMPKDPSKKEEAKAWLDHMADVFGPHNKETDPLKLLQSFLRPPTTIRNRTRRTRRRTSPLSTTLDPFLVQISKDHLKPPPGGWGVDYNPYTYYFG